MDDHPANRASLPIDEGSSSSLISRVQTVSTDPENPFLRKSDKTLKPACVFAHVCVHVPHARCVHLCLTGVHFPGIVVHKTMSLM